MKFIAAVRVSKIKDMVTEKLVMLLKIRKWLLVKSKVSWLPLTAQCTVIHVFSESKPSLPCPQCTLLLSYLLDKQMFTDDIRVLMQYCKKKKKQTQRKSHSTKHVKQHIKPWMKIPNIAKSLILYENIQSFCFQQCHRCKEDTNT